jgi:hypothetical protein
VDLILGAPDWSHFRALRYSTAVVAPDTGTPYSLDGEFVRGAEEFVARCRAMATVDGPRPPVVTPAVWEQQGDGEAAAAPPVADGGRVWKRVAV